MKLSSLLLVVLLSAATSFGVMKYADPASTAAAPTRETAFERVMRTNTLRCGYVLLPPELARDPNTGAFSGVSYDLVNEIAKRLDLKVEWTEEVNFMTVGEGFKTDRYDAFCFTTYRWVPSSRIMEYTVPLFYTTTAAYVRPDDHRFDADISKINDPNVKVATIDSEASTFIRAADYPLSTPYSMPVNTDFASALESVATGKADVALVNPLVALPYLTSNPNQVRRIVTPTPLRSYSHVLAFGKGEHDLTSMFNVVLEEIHDDGTMDKIIDKYETIANSFVRIKRAVDFNAKETP